jgi:peroxiredoxin
MRNPRLLISTLLVAGILLIGVSIIVLISPKTAEALESGAAIILPATATYPAPDLALIDLGGKMASLVDYQGSVVLVNNWATWCPPCQEEMPELQAYYADHAADGFVLIAIEAGEPRDEVAAFASEFNLTFSIWLDPHGKSLQAFQNWDLPSSYLIDRDGNVLYAWIGAVNQQTLEKYITPLLER